MGELQARILANLRRFNAKERDHLMRFAYLGVQTPYDAVGPWLSPACLAACEALARPHLVSEARCVFAAMDYHLDWLHAALALAHEAPDWDGLSDTRAFPRRPDPSEPTATGLLVEGSQEDVDLLVAFQDARGLLLLFVEAKSSERFDPAQLGRKLLRLDAILRHTLVDGVRGLMVLASPETPRLGKDPVSGRDRDCRQFAAQARHAAGRERGISDALAEAPVGVGCEWAYLALPNFPSATAAVTRVKGNRRSASGENWKAISRWRRGESVASNVVREDE